MDPVIVKFRITISILSEGTAVGMVSRDHVVFGVVVQQHSGVFLAVGGIAGDLVVVGGVDQGDASTLCRTVASRVARAGDRLPELRTIEITTGTFRMSDYFRGRSAPVSENVGARCNVDQSRR